jgi:D-alanyl-D-alanine carboxypeptidase
MVPHRPHRRQPAHVYRVRRAIAATAVVLVVFGVLRLAGVAGGDSGGEDETTVTTAATTTTTIPDPPACVEGDVVTQDNPATGWQTIIVDTERALPDWYAPPDLTNISEAGFEFTPGQALRGFVMADLSAMREAARANGTPLSIVASYRSYVQQADLFNRRVDEMGAAEAGSRVARPGHSEHQLGTTLDVTSEGLPDVDQAWGASPTGQWVASNAHRYGFLISYPSGASAATCYDFEPWHLRYVGRELAAAVVDSGLTLREHLFAFHPPAGYVPAPTTTSTTAAIDTET